MKIALIILLILIILALVFYFMCLDELIDWLEKRDLNLKKMDEGLLNHKEKILELSQQSVFKSNFDICDTCGGLFLKEKMHKVRTEYSGDEDERDSSPITYEFYCQKHIKKYDSIVKIYRENISDNTKKVVIKYFSGSTEVDENGKILK